MNRFSKLCLLGLLFVSGPGFAEVSVEEELQRAQKALQEAAQRMAELYSQKYEVAGGSKRAMLGVLLGPEDSAKGVPLVGTTPKSGAAKAGIQAGDLLVRAGDVDLAGAEHPTKALSRYMKNVAPGDTVSLSLLRDGERIDVDVVTHARSTHIMQLIGDKGDFDFDFDFDFDHLGDHGVRHIEKIEASHSEELLAVSGDLANYFDVESGVIVLQPDEKSQLKGGDVVLEISDEPVQSVKQAADLLGKLDEQVEVRVKRRGRDRTVEVMPGEFDTSVHKEIKVIRIRSDGGEKGNPAAEGADSD